MNEWRKEPCSIEGFAYLVACKPDGAWDTFPLPEWLVDTILQEHELAQKRSGFESGLFVTVPRQDIEAAEARIAELEAVLKAVEWSNHSEAVAEESHCSFCLNWKSEGHEESCIVHKALQ